MRRPPDPAGWSAPASQPLTAHGALHDHPGQHLGQPEHLHFNNQGENLLCYPVVGPQGSPAHFLLVIKDGRWPREGAEREAPGQSTPGATGSAAVRRQGTCAGRRAGGATPPLGLSPAVPRSKEDMATAQGWIICTCAHPGLVCPHMLLKENVSETSITTASERCAKKC